MFNIYKGRSLFKQFNRKFSTIENIFTDAKLREYNEKGFTVLPKVFSKDYIEELKGEIRNILNGLDAKEIKTIFDTSHANNDDYFLESGDKVKVF